MEVLTDVEKIQRGPAAIALGNFDGCHLGHLDLFKHLQPLARAEKLERILFTFSPHPREVLNPHHDYQSLYPRESLHQFAREYFDFIVLQKFDFPFSQLMPREFVQKYLVQPLKVKTVVVGEGFRFGKNQMGDVYALEELGREFGFSVYIIPAKEIGGERISTSLIRKMLRNGDVDSAAKFLGRYHAAEGTVVEGDRRGRELGFPTANLAVQKGYQVPAGGVYAGYVEFESQIYPAVANLGVRPTFKDSGVLSLEVHLLDQVLNLYGRTLSFQFVSRIRDEMKFSGRDALMAQIQSDIASAKKRLLQ